MAALKQRHSHLLPSLSADELELDGLSDGDQQEEEDVHVPVFYNGIPQEVLDIVFAHDLAALAADELAAPAPEPKDAQGNPILTDWYVLSLLNTSYNMLTKSSAPDLVSSLEFVVLEIQGRDSFRCSP